MRYTLALLTVLVGCGNSSNGVDGGNNPDLSSAGTPDLNGTAVSLTIKNYLQWCAVTVNGGAVNTDPEQTLTFAPGTTVHLNGDKKDGTFVWGYWFGTVNDTSAAHDTSMSATVVMDHGRVVQACCPFANAPNTPCPAP